MSGAGKERKRGKDEGGGKGGNKKAKYFNKSSDKSNAAIPAGAQGILLTCDTTWEERAANELITIIEEHYDHLAASQGGSGGEEAAAGSSGQGGAEGNGAAGGTGGGSKDIAALLAEEVAGLKDRSKRRFSAHQMGIKGCAFITFPQGPGPSPQDVVLSILREAQRTKTLRTRHCNRLLPITHSCYASLESMASMAPSVVEGHFPADEAAAGVPFAVDYEHRSAEGFDRLAVINCFVDHIKVPPNKVNLKEPAKTVLVQMVRNACGAAVVTHYRELAKYNIRKLSEVEEELGGAGDKEQGANKGKAEQGGKGKEEQGKQEGDK